MMLLWLMHRRNVRTSQGTFMSRHDDPAGVIAWVEEKAAQVTGLPVSHGEVLFLHVLHEPHSLARCFCCFTPPVVLV